MDIHPDVDKFTRQERAFRTPLLISAVLLSLSFLSPSLSPHSRASQGSPQEEIRIPEISTPKIENMIDVGGRKLHGFLYGKGSPTVVLVSGLDAPQAYWNSVIPDLAAKTTVVTYDRAGVGKSEMGDLPAHGAQAAKDLHVWLEKLSVPKPYILVGHSYGGNVVRLFASMFPADMGGLILEDTQHEDVLIEMRKILKGKDLEAFDQLMADRFSTPENPKTEADYRNMTRDQVKKSGPLPQIPFVVLAAAGRAKAMAEIFSAEAIGKMDKLDGDLNNQLAALIPGGKLIIVEGTGHNIHLDKPEVLIAPVAEMIKLVREK